MFKYGNTVPSQRTIADKASRRLARNVFRRMVRYQTVERKQAFLFRTVDIAMEIALMCAVESV